MLECRFTGSLSDFFKGQKIDQHGHGFSQIAALHVSRRKRDGLDHAPVSCGFHWIARCTAKHVYENLQRYDYPVKRGIREQGISNRLLLLSEVPTVLMIGVVSHPERTSRQRSIVTRSLNVHTATNDQLDTKFCFP